MKRLCLVAGVLAVLAGCASTQEVLDKDAAITVHSTLKPADAAFCLGNKVSSPVYDKGDGTRVIVAKNMWGGAQGTITVAPEGEGSRIEYRKGFGSIGAIKRMCLS